jgi:hypothetical protein
MSTTHFIAYFSHIDKFKQLHFMQNTKTTEQLQKIYGEAEIQPLNDTGDIDNNVDHAAFPFDKQTFHCVIVGKHGNHVPGVVEQLVGLVCDVKVKQIHYNFISKLEHNYGKRVCGSRLQIIDIKPSSEPID